MIENTDLILQIVSEINNVIDIYDWCLFHFFVLDRRCHWLKKDFEAKLPHSVEI